ncbi:MAG: hypothetical protein LBJ10_03155 [Clostridiales bacterium]|nr:hypothetical protein [Clostridiales bacterium]
MGYGVLQITFNLVFSPLTVLAFVSEAYVPILSAFMAADSYSMEMRSGYLNWQRATAGGGAAVYFAKLLAMFVFNAANVLALFLASLAFALLLPVGGLSAAQICEALVAYAVTVVPVMAMTAMFAFVAALFKSRFAAIFAGAALYIGARAAGLASNAVSGASFLSYVQWHVLWTGGMLPAPKLANIFLMLLSATAVFASAGYIAMELRAGSLAGAEGRGPDGKRPWRQAAAKGNGRSGNRQG